MGCCRSLYVAGFVYVLSGVWLCVVVFVKVSGESRERETG